MWGLGGKRRGFSIRGSMDSWYHPYHPLSSPITPITPIPPIPSSTAEGTCGPQALSVLRKGEEAEGRAGWWWWWW